MSTSQAQGLPSGRAEVSLLATPAPWPITTCHHRAGGKQLGVIFKANLTRK